MNKLDINDINKNKLHIGDTVVLCDCAEAVSREFEFWEVYAYGTTSLVYIKGLTSGKTDSFDCKCLKKVDKKYKEFEKATPIKILKSVDENGEPCLPRNHGVCPICGFVVEYSDKYCHECGQRLELRR